MSDDKPKETHASPAPSSSSEPSRWSGLEVQERVSSLERQVLVTLPRLADNVEKIWDRSAWRIKLESSRSDHILGLAAAVERDAVSRDRQTEAVLLLRQAISEHGEDVRYIRAGVDAILLRFNIKEAVDKTVADAKKAVADAIASAVTEETRTAAVIVAQEGDKTRIAIAAAVREASGVQKVIIERAPEEEGKVGALARAYGVFARADKFTKALTVLLAFFATSALLGYLFYKLQVGAEEPQGRPMKPHASETGK